MRRTRTSVNRGHLTSVLSGHRESALTGRLISAASGDGQSLSYDYDTLDRVMAVRSPLGAVSYGYDAAGRRTHMDVAGTPRITYGFDAASRLTSISRAPMAPAGLEYDAAGRRTQLALPNQVSTEYQYDAASHLTALIYRNAARQFGDLTYQYDRAGNRVGVGGSFARTLLPDAVADATYDAANRQLSFGTATMAYDANGGMTDLTEPTGGMQFGWDARGRLATLITPTANLAFTYDPSGRRVERRLGTLVTKYLYDGSDIVEEVTGTSSASYLRALTIDEPLSRGTGEFYLADALGSVVGLTDSDGAPGARYTYAPFGGTVIDGVSENLLQFTGRENDEIGVYYYRARYYHPGLHRFVSSDPMGIGAGDTNLYAYVRNRPTGFVDPLGLQQRPSVLPTDPVLGPPDARECIPRCKELNDDLRESLTLSEQTKRDLKDAAKSLLEFLIGVGCLFARAECPQVITPTIPKDSTNALLTQQPPAGGPLLDVPPDPYGRKD
jgi:RHS repeat-associated protein